LDEWIDDSLRKSKPIGLTLCAARSTIADHRARITEMWDALETLRRERDEAREKIKRQAERICQLEGATNHAGGTPLSIALREREEVRQQYDDLATEHMLVVNKLAEERDQALMDRANGDMATMTRNHYERLIKERDEARFLLKAAQSALDAIHLEVGGWIKIMKENTD
jgi:hypothetical protein